MKQKYSATKDQKLRFAQLCKSRVVPIDVAFFAFCLVFDVPYRAENHAADWQDYLAQLDEAENAGFEQGEKDPMTVVINALTDRERWKSIWGIGDEEHPYSDEDYLALDESFRRYASRLTAAGGYDLQQEDILRNCSRLALLRDKSIAKGDKEGVDMAAKLDKMIQDNLASENLRKKDAKPAENAKVDGFVDVLRKKTGLTMELTKEQVFEAYRKWCLARHYPATQDAVEHALLAIINCTRNNSDMEPLTDLPEEARLDLFATEFETDPDLSENDAYDYLAISRGKRTQGGI